MTWSLPVLIINGVTTYVGFTINTITCMIYYDRIIVPWYWMDKRDSSDYPELGAFRPDLFLKQTSNKYFTII